MISMHIYLINDMPAVAVKSNAIQALPATKDHHHPCDGSAQKDTYFSIVFGFGLFFSCLYTARKTELIISAYDLTNTPRPE